MSRQCIAGGLLFLWILAAAVHASPPLGDPALLFDEPDSYWRNSLSGGPGKDGIPSIDEPRFLSAGAVGNELSYGDQVIGVHHNGEARAYPQQILVWHEIVNDRVGGDNLSITYCPLTGTSLGFLRGDTSLGVSGRLVNSNLIMYDRATDTHWTQMLGTGISGVHTGEGLQEVRVFWTTWGQWRERYPDTEVLSSRTGYARNYRRDPYGGYNPVRGYYAEPSAPIFPPLNSDSRFPAKKPVFGFRTAFEAVAVDKDRLETEPVLHYSGMEHDFAIVHDAGLDTVQVFELDSRVQPDALPAGPVDFGPDATLPPVLSDAREINGYEAFWFAWYGFYPGTDLLE